MHHRLLVLNKKKQSWLINLKHRKTQKTLPEENTGVRTWENKYNFKKISKWKELLLKSITIFTHLLFALKSTIYNMQWLEQLQLSEQLLFRQ